MVNRFLMAWLAVFALAAQAQAVSFTSASFDVTAIAISDGVPDIQIAASPPDPVSVSAASVGVDVATAGAIGGPGLLSTSADVSGLGGIVSAVATSHFLGSFVSGSQVLLGIDFTASDFLSGTGGGGSTLFVTLMNGASTVFSDYLSESRLFSYAAAPGTVGTLELTLSSEANAGLLAAGPGGFSSFALVGITTPVPEPASCVLLLVGLFALRLVTRRQA